MSGLPPTLLSILEINRLIQTYFLWLKRRLSVTVNLNPKNLFSYLIDAAICKKDDLKYMKLDVGSSKNFNWVIDLSGNRGKLVVKQNPHSMLYINGRLHKEWHIYNFLQSNKNLTYASSLTPETIHFDQENSILIYKVPNNYITLENYFKNQINLPNRLSELIGSTLAKLHMKTINFQSCYNFIAQFEEGKLHCQLLYNYLCRRCLSWS